MMFYGGFHLQVLLTILLKVRKVGKLCKSLTAQAVPPDVFSAQIPCSIAPLLRVAKRLANVSLGQVM